MGVSNKSKNKDAAFTTMDFWLTKAADLEFAKTAGQQPKRTSSLSDPFFDKPENSYVLNRKKTSFRSLLKIRANFLPELINSTDNL